MDFVLVQPDSLRSVWPFVRDGLADLPASDWIAEDVYHAIRSGESALYLALTGEGRQGFFVVRRRVEEFSRSVSLHVWIGFSVGDADLYVAGEQFLRSLAQQCGAQRITFGSPRPGWGKRYPLIEATYEIPMETQA